MRRILQTASSRCVECRLPARWCICDAVETVSVPLAIDVLVHHREWHRPSSTGGLIGRILPDARRHLWRRERGFKAADLQIPGRELWILHPHGADAPTAPAEQVQVVLLDGSWPESSAMAQEVAGWGRLVSLPLAGESRYWLRAQAEGARFSTFEALIAVLEKLGCADAAMRLRLQFELHVYAGLRARGRKERAAEFLSRSPLREALPDFLAQINTPRPR